MNMPQLCDFDPRPVGLRSMDEKDRRARENTKTGKQEWFSKDEDEEVKKVKVKRTLHSIALLVKNITNA